MVYESMLRPLLFRGEPERMHDRAMAAGEWAAHSRLACAAAEALCVRPYPRLETEVAGIRFPSPLGLAAGFDKNGRAVRFWAALGFGHVEIGSISAERSLGNPKPRLFRVPQDRGIVVNYGLPNDGAERIAERLAASAAGTRLGINIVSTNRGPGAPPESDDAIIGDYAASVRKLEPFATYLVLNLSCPNTCDGRAFVSNRERVRRLLDAVREIEVRTPVFLKVAPFGEVRELEAFLEAVEGFGFVSGFSVNLPPGKPSGMSTPESVLKSMPGAVSGWPCRAVALRALRELYRRMDRRRYCVIGSGGVFTGGDAYEMIRAGASLVQSLTALIYRGPRAAQRICAELDGLLVCDGVVSVQDVVGSNC